MSEQQRSTPSFIGNFAHAGKKIASLLQSKARLVFARIRSVDIRKIKKNRVIFAALSW